MLLLSFMVYQALCPFMVHKDVRGRWTLYSHMIVVESNSSSLLFVGWIGKHERTLKEQTKDS